MTEKPKRLVTEHSKHKHKSTYRQIENFSHVKSQVISEKCKCAIKGISDLESL